MALTQHRRRTLLQKFARQEFSNPSNSRCQALVHVVARAAELVRGLPFPARRMINDLEQVLIGEDMLSGRGAGPYYAGTYPGSSGFQCPLDESSYQARHAMAGIVIGFRYGWLGHGFAHWQEDEPEDDALYNATCLLGRRLNDSNYDELSWELSQAVGESILFDATFCQREHSLG